MERGDSPSRRSAGTSVRMKLPLNITQTTPVPPAERTGVGRCGVASRRPPPPTRQPIALSGALAAGATIVTFSPNLVIEIAMLSKQIITNLEIVHMPFRAGRVVSISRPCMQVKLAKLNKRNREVCCLVRDNLSEIASRFPSAALHAAYSWGTTLAAWHTAPPRRRANREPDGSPKGARAPPLPGSPRLGPRDLPAVRRSGRSH